MTQQAALASEALAEFRRVQPPDGRADDRDLRSLMDAHRIVEFTIRPADRSAAESTRNGMVSLSKLAADLLAGRTGPPTASARTLGCALSKLATSLWRSRPAGDLSEEDPRLLSKAAQAWFRDQVRPGVHNDEPGRGMAPGALEVTLAIERPQLQSIGRRLDGFLAGGRIDARARRGLMRRGVPVSLGCGGAV